MRDQVVAAVDEAIHKMPNAETKPTMTVPEAGEWMGLGRASAYEAAHAGVIPTIRAGRRLLVPTAKFRAVLGL